MAIPIMGIVLFFIYAFGNNENVNKQNWAKAQLIMLAIVSLPDEVAAMRMIYFPLR